VNHLLIAISGALGVCVVALAVLAASLARRGGKRADERVSEVVRVLERRMDELAVELAGAVERAEEEGRRSRFLGEIAGSIKPPVHRCLSVPLVEGGSLFGAVSLYAPQTPELTDYHRRVVEAVLRHVTPAIKLRADAALLACSGPPANESTERVERHIARAPAFTVPSRANRTVVH